MTAELMELKATLAQSQERERKSGSLVQELTAMVKEQKSRISELIKAKRDAVTDLKVCSTAVREWDVGDFYSSISTGFEPRLQDLKYWNMTSYEIPWAQIHQSLPFQKHVNPGPVGDWLLWDIMNTEWSSCLPICHPWQMAIDH